MGDKQILLAWSCSPSSPSSVMSGIEQRTSWMSFSDEETESIYEDHSSRLSPSMASNVVLSLNSPMNPDSNKNIALYGFRDPKSFARPPKHALPDPNQFPDPYPYRQQQSLSSTPPALSSSSSGSTRSSAYTSGGSGGSALVADLSHVRVASNDNDEDGRITSDSVSQLMEKEPRSHERSRWSEASIRSRSSSVGTSSNDHHMSPRLQQKKSYDMGWQNSVDERDEFAASEEETDEDHLLLQDDGDELDDDEERTSAALIAEEGRGMIIQGEGVPVTDLNVLPGTTHLLLGSSGSPNALPSFLTTVIPQICTSLLALDISANFLNALPPTLALCVCLEELNIASNPLRVLPVFLADLLHLRVIIADSTGITTLPDTLVDLDKLHTISIRRNKMNALPSWLSLLPALQTLYGPWKALVEPLLAKVPSTPIYPLSTPTFPLHSPSSGDQDTDDDLSEPPSSGPNPRRFDTLSPDEEEHTITPDRARSPSEGRGLTRTRTTPNRSHHPIPRRGTTAAAANPTEDSGYVADHEVRRMKSAGDLRLNRAGGDNPSRPAMQHYPTSLSSTNLLSQTPPRPGMQKRFASVGPANAMAMDGSPSRNGPPRPQLTQSMWDNNSHHGSGEADDAARSRASSFVSQTQGLQGNTSPPRMMPVFDGASTIRAPPPGKEKNSRWGFLKKMSMGKMKIETSPRPMPSAAPRIMRGPATAPISDGSPGRFSPQIPQINMRISTTGSLDAFNTPPAIHKPLPPAAEEEEPQAALRPPSITSPSSLAPPASGSLLVPPTTTRTAKRRSFLPLDTPALTLNIPIPEASAFVPGLTATGGDGDEGGLRVETPSPVAENYLRREEERAREAYQRALRSVMAYLKDMNDLGLSQQANTMGVYGANGDEALQPRSRRPTVAGLDREASVSSTGSSIDSQLRSLDSLTGRGNSTQTNSVATTDSSGSGDERKYKDDKGKRAMVVREIVITERTYVKGLQELVDIYIKPGAAPVNVLGGSSKETVVPASERKIVFSGVESLFSFHKESFLPALEIAAAPLMRSSAELAEADADGQLSLTVAKAIGNMFLKHAAFMKMYSSYINNFDNAVQRVKNWSAAPLPTNGAPPVAPSASQLAGLGLALSAISTPSMTGDGGASGVPTLSTSQRKRLRSYLKRCRISPRHSQLNLEGYLLLPVQRIPRYRLLLEELLRATPPTYEYMDDPLDRSLAEISLLANNMNEGKRESESRRKLVQWQSRIRGKFPSPLVQPHRRLIMDGPLLLTRVVRKAMVSFESINAQGDPCNVQVDCLAPELTPRPLVGILCNDLLVLCRDPSDGQDPSCHVDLWAVLRMQTLPQPASIVHGNALRLVDNKAILYFDAPSPSDALNWYRAINLHIPKT
ncbi:DH domain-containing protein [Favolaschia claudopus]|uniref:DH domain-containing protein n=1 Tax=Favolaschia claudopus TaxID=2862362 RepID=A0AAW0EIV7_9AGAR